MVPVRKPGRPLSACPHPPNKPCGCGGVTAAIPRVQKCRCGGNSSSSSTSSAGTGTPRSEPISSRTPGSPTKRSFHIHKLGTKQSSRIDTAGLERTDITNLNIHAPPSWNPAALPVMNDGGFIVPSHSPAASLPYQSPMSAHPSMQNGFQSPGTTEYDSPFMLPAHHPVQIPLPPQASLAVGPEQDARGDPATAQHNMPAPAASRTNGSSGGGGGGSCCAPAVAQSPRHTPTSSLGSATSGAETATTSACSSCKPAETKVNGLHSPAEIKANGVGLAHSPVMTTDGAAMMMPFGQTMVSQQMYASYFQPPIPVMYTYPASYGTVSSPLQPAQWRQTVATVAYDHQGLQPNPIGVGSGGQLGPNGTTMLAGGGTSHLCSCGDSCNCLGCQAHPYNEATQNYIRSAMNSMTEHRHTDSLGRGIMDDKAGGVGSSATTAAAAGAGLDHGHEPASPQQAHTPSDASGISEDQAQLSASDFFFVTYPLDQCGGETTSCPCGDDCQCIGCLIHGTSSSDETPQ